ncbi:MAG: hypothetical protein EST26_08830 [Hydrogenophaga sp.]|nr:hypothetical protein [Hydrogenophaga sp.]
MMEMQTQTAAALAMFASAVFVWLLWGFFWLRRRLREPANGRLADAREIGLGWWRWSGLSLMFGSVGMAAVVLLLSAQDAAPGDWIAVLFIGAFAGGGTLTGWLLWRTRIRVSAAGVQGYCAALLPRYLAWDDIRQARYSAFMEAIKLTGTTGKPPVYVSAYIDDFAGFMRTLRERAPAAQISIDAKTRAEDLMQTGHFESLEKHALTGFALASAVFALTLPVLPPHLPALALAGGAGALLAAFPILRRLRPRLSERAPMVGNLIQGAALFASIVMLPRAISRHEAHLGGPDAISSGEGLILLMQYLSFSMLTPFLLLLAAKRLCPKHFSLPENRNNT